ncbi:hypothetical protein [Roseiconus lacunae]|uniref:Uncharacterized protein n=1 Tax=Roseiconus lacunae TaxID=2605694 RepID=A0ABT7PPM4_9BACT|nr:hypothetical protein [Roseiconus lacunae]MDM4018457.1 hypothetical protein [Roseiconus lacunae]
MKQTLLVAASAPGLQGVGGFLIDQMLNVDGVQPVSFAGIINEKAAAESKRDRLQSFEIFPPYNEWYTDQINSVAGAIKRYLVHRTHYDQHVRNQADLIEHYMLSQQPEQLWLILNSLAAIDVAYRITNAFRGDIITQIWDDPTHLCRQRNVDRYSRSRTHKRFRQLLDRSTRIGVIGEDAQKAYRPFSNAPAVIVRYGSGEQTPDVSNQGNDPAEFRIGLAGSMYATDAWEALQRSLDQVEWTIDGRRIVLVVAGNKITFSANSNAAATFRGWCNQTELRSLLAECDCLYLPQSFSSRSRELTELSFPTKLSDYVATGRPVFVHAPAYGSVARFCRRNQFGTVCQSLTPDDILETLRPLVQDPQKVEHQSQASVRVATEVLTYEAFASGTRQLLGIEEVD